MKIIVRAPNWIGDAVLAWPAIQSLSQSPSVSQVWITGCDWVKDIFPSLGPIQGFIPLPDSAGPGALWKAARILKKHRFDACLLLTNSFSSALLFFLAGIPQRWGYKRDGRGFLLTKRIRFKKKEAPLHQVRYYLDLISSLGFEASSPEFGFDVDEEESRQAQVRLESLGVESTKPLVVLNPGAFYGPAKRWPPRRFAELAVLFQERVGAQILIIGSAEERELAETISAQMKIKPLVLSGKTTLPQLAAILHLATLLVTNDSGPMHLANALKIPVVAIFGPTKPEETGPFQQPSSVVQKKVSCWPCQHRECPTDHRCMQEISAEDLFSASEGYLK